MICRVRLLNRIIGIRGVLACSALAAALALGATRATAQTISAPDSSTATRLGINSAAVATQKTEISLPQYRSELDRISADLEHQLNNPPTNSDAKEQFDPQVPAVWVVESGGEKVEVPTADLRFEIDRKMMDASSREQRFRRAIEQVRIMRTEASTLASESSPSSASTARAELAEILQRREFRQVHEQKSWLAQLWDRFLSWIWRIITRIFGAANNKVVQKTVLYGAIVVAFLLLAWTLVRTMTMAARRENLRLAAAPPAGKTWSQWAREAIAAANAGNYRAAIHAAYWAGVYRMAEIGTWQLDRARTPREYLRMLQRAPQPAIQSADAGAAGSAPNPLADPSIRARRAEALATLTNRLEAVWYDNQNATQEDFRIAVQNLETLECRFPSMPQTASS